jgi:hydroxyacylglutathione hydrolase
MSNYEANVIKPFNCKGADIVFKDNFILKWGEHNLKLMETPGHALGSICILLDEQWIFTGDSLLADVDVITRLPGGSRKKYKEITLPILNDLSKDLQVYSGHGRSFKLGSMIL